jgi:uncharacterized protein (TIGR03086 family)
MQEQNTSLLAETALQRVVDQIRDDQWAMVMPPSFAIAADSPITLREVITSHAYDDAWVPDMLTGRTMDETGKDTFQGDLLGDDPKGNFTRIVAAASTAVRELDDLERVVHCSFGDYTAREYLWQINSVRGLRAHDIADVIGVDSTLPDELVQGLWDELAPVADEWRSYGVFGPKVEVPDDAPLQDRLLGLTGRQP